MNADDMLTGALPPFNLTEEEEKMTWTTTSHRTYQTVFEDHDHGRGGEGETVINCRSILRMRIKGKSAWSKLRFESKG